MVEHAAEGYRSPFSGHLRTHVEQESRAAYFPTRQSQEMRTLGWDWVSLHSRQETGRSHGMGTSEGALECGWSSAAEGKFNRGSSGRRRGKEERKYQERLGGRKLEGILFPPVKLTKDFFKLILGADKDEVREAPSLYPGWSIKSCSLYFWKAGFGTCIDSFRMLHLLA